MYVNPFWFGFCCGALVTMGVIFIIAWFEGRHE